MRKPSCFVYLNLVYLGLLGPVAALAQNVSQPHTCEPGTTYYESFFKNSISPKATPKNSQKQGGQGGMALNGDVLSRNIAEVSSVRNQKENRSTERQEPRKLERIEVAQTIPRTQADFTNRDLQPLTEIPHSCIEASMRKFQGEPTGSRYDCFARKRVDSKKGPCVTDAAVTFMANQVNGALRCINSSKDAADVKVSPREFFAIINGESGFQGKVSSWESGVGVPQLTLITLQDFLKRGGAYKEWESVRDNRECKEFYSAAGSAQVSEQINSLKERSLTATVGGYCEIISPRYYGRSFIIALSLYKYKKKEARAELQDLVSSNGPDIWRRIDARRDEIDQDIKKFSEAEKAKISDTAVSKVANAELKKRIELYRKKRMNEFNEFSRNLRKQINYIGPPIKKRIKELREEKNEKMMRAQKDEVEGIENKYRTLIENESRKLLAPLPPSFEAAEELLTEISYNKGNQKVWLDAHRFRIQQDIRRHQDISREFTRKLKGERALEKYRAAFLDKLKKRLELYVQMKNENGDRSKESPSVNYMDADKYSRFVSNLETMVNIAFLKLEATAGDSLLGFDDFEKYVLPELEIRSHRLANPESALQFKIIADTHREMARAHTRQSIVSTDEYTDQIKKRYDQITHRLESLCPF